MTDGGRPGAPVDLLEASGLGPVWGVASEDLNATLLAWSAGDGVEEHINDERDALLVVVAGPGRLWFDSVEQELRPSTDVLVEKGHRGASRRAQTAPLPIVHLPRPPVQLEG